MLDAEDNANPDDAIVVANNTMLRTMFIVDLCVRALFGVASGGSMSELTRDRASCPQKLDAELPE